MKKIIEIIDTVKGKIEFARNGEGTPVLYLHGSLANCNDEFGHKQLIDAGYSIITPSRPGYGKTPVLNCLKEIEILNFTF